MREIFFEMGEGARAAWSGVLGAVLALVFALGVCPPASATPTELWTKCDEEDSAVQCDTPRSIGVDRENGHIFVTDQVNRRVLEFNARGDFIKTWGWDVVLGGGTEFEICVPADGDICKSGLNGSGTGQLSVGLGVGVDSASDIYVVDFSNRRVQKFDSDGNFVLMFGGDVNKTKVEEGGKTEAEENVCSIEAGDDCQKGVSGAGQGQFGSWAIGSYLAIDLDDNVYVGDDGRVQRFDTGGNYQDECAVPGRVEGLSADAGGDLYLKYSGEPGVRKMTPPPACELLAEPVFEVKDLKDNLESASGVAVDSAGRVFVLGPGEDPEGGSVIYLDPIHEFDAGGNLLDKFGKEEFGGSTGIATNLCAGSEAPGNLYVANFNPLPGIPLDDFVRAYGTEPDGCFNAKTLAADPVEETAATLNGTVNPKGEAVTACFFEWGETTEYDKQAPCVEPSAGEIGTGSEPVSVRADLSGLDPGTVHHFRLVAEVGGEAEAGADEAFKTLGPAAISGEHVRSAALTEATLAALVSPEGFGSSCRFEYLTQEAFEAGGFAGAQSSTPQQVGEDGDRSEHVLSETITGLQAGTAYRWRIACSNLSGPSQGGELLLNTYRAPAPGDGCSNQALRGGASALLPDCRAYEMVSPVEKNGGDILQRDAADVRSTPAGGRITYATIPSFGDQESAYVLNQYLATRDADGWSNRGIHPPGNGEIIVEGIPLRGAVRDFLAFTPDLCSAWLWDYLEPSFTSDGQENLGDLYRRDNCEPGAGGLEALMPAPPQLPEATPSAYVDANSVQGVSEDGRHAIFVATASLPHAPEAAPGNKAQIYDRFGGGVRLVSVLPSGAPSEEENAVGGGSSKNLAQAVSAEGSHVYWIAGITGGDGEGRLFLRLRPEQEQSAIEAGKCTEPAKACTLRVSANLSTTESPGDAFFWTASRDGSKALYSENNDLYEFDLNEGGDPQTRLVFAGIDGVAGASEDLSRIYFATSPTRGTGNLSEGSTTVANLKATAASFRPGQAIEGAGVAPGTTVASVGINTLELSAPATTSGDKVALTAQALPTGGQENKRGEVAQLGRPNLYLDEGGELTYVASPLEIDVQAVQPGLSGGLPYDLVSKEPRLRTVRLSPDGSRLVFQSRAPLTGYDNTDQATGKAALEVFAYDADADELDCISCNPSRARPVGRELRKPYWAKGPQGHGVWAAAWIPAPEQQLHASNLVSADGERIFFNSNDALVPRDTNGTMDVYQWEAVGKGSCTVGSPSHFPQNGGCVDLVSTGESPFESEFWEASESGDDVFFTTESSLVPPDEGLVDLYDARVGGGFSYPEEPVECEGENCQSPPAPPAFPAPASGAYRGPGNERPLSSCARPARRAAALSRRAKRARRVARRSRGPAARRMSRKARRFAGRAKALSRNAKRCRRQARRAAR